MALFKQSVEEDTIRNELLKKSTQIASQTQTNDISKIQVNKKKTIEYLEENKIKANDAIKIYGSKEKYDKELRTFNTFAREKFNKLIEYKASMNSKEYTNECEKLKEKAALLGFDELFLITKTHTIKAGQNNINYIAENFKTFEDELMRIMNVISDYIN